MKTKYHPNTQKSINKWAHRYLQLYRNSRAYDDPATARWRSHFAMCIHATGNVYNIIEARLSKNNRLYWKATGK